VARKTRRGLETSEVLKTFEDLNRGVCLSRQTAQGRGRAGKGRGRIGQGRGSGRAGQDSPESSFFFVLTKTTFFFLLATVRPD